MKQWFLYKMLQMVGHEAFVASPNKKKGESVKTAIHFFNSGEQTYAEREGHPFGITIDWDDVKSASTYDALYIPGGRAPEHLRMNDKVISLVKEFAKEGKIIAAICHGPQVLAAAGIATGIQVTAYSALKHDMLAAGCTWQDCPFDGAHVSADGKIITGCTWAGHPKFVGALLHALGTKIIP